MLTSSAKAKAHRITQIDKEKQTAICAVCGPVTVYPRDRGKFWRCSTVAKAKSQRNYKKTFDRKRDTRLAKQRARHLWVCYHITPEELAKIEAFQKAHEIYRLLLGKNHGTDHCHKTGLIRGRLDWRINRAYGLLERACPDNLAAVLRALAHYHENPPAELALGEKKYGLIGEAKYKKKMVYGPPTNATTVTRRSYRKAIGSSQAQ